MKIGTKVIHSGIKPDAETSAIMTPIYQTSTFVQEGIGNHKGYTYSRSKNPTRNALENNLASLENGKYGACFSSGMAAIESITKLLEPGDEVITSLDLYGGTFRLFSSIGAKNQIKFHFLEELSSFNIEQKINDNTRLIWVETPSNPMLNIVDIAAVSEISRNGKIILSVDNTFASPYIQNPLDLGADIVVHSVTKFINGHSDVIMGAVITSNDAIAEHIYGIQNNAGAIPGPMDCFLVLRGIKTLHVRMQKHCENAEIVANWLRANNNVKNVYYPGFENHKNHHIAKRQMRAFGGMISFSLHNDTIEAAKTISSKMKFFKIAESLGGVESLVSHPASMTHGSFPKNEREKIGISDSLIRLSVGIEDINDLIYDLENSIGK